MNNHITLDEILKDYPKVNNLSELLDSDILVLPLCKGECGFSSKVSKLSNENKDLSIKYYITKQTKWGFEAGVDTYINLGILVISTIEILIKLANWIKEKHNRDTIETSIYVHIGDNYYVSNTFRGRGDTVGNEIEKFRNKLN